MFNKFLDKIKEKYKEIYLQYDIYESVWLGVLLATVGGFLDAYTFVGRGGVFSNAQTGNIVFLGVYASQREWQQALVHVPPIVAFVIGVFIAECIKNNSLDFCILDWKRGVLILEIIVLFIVGFIPNNVPNIVVNVMISFVASIQVSSFRKLVDSTFNTTMSTGNLRLASQAVYIAITKKDRKSAIKAIRFVTIISSFLFGAFLGGLLTLIIGIKAIWVAVAILIFVVILFSIYEQKTSMN